VKILCFWLITSKLTLLTKAYFQGRPVRALGDA